MVGAVAGASAAGVWVWSAGLGLAAACAGAAGQGTASQAPASGQAAASGQASPQRLTLTPTAGEAAAAVEDITPWWTFRIEALAFYVAPAGDLRLPGGDVRGDEFDVIDLNLDSPQLEPYITGAFSKGKWRVAFDGFGASYEQSTGGVVGQVGRIGVLAGERIETDFTYVGFGVNGSYRVLGWADRADEQGVRALVAGVDLLAGLRFHYLDVDAGIDSASPLRAAGSVTQTSEESFFGDVIGGVRLDLEFGETYGIEVYVAAGGFGTGDRSSFSFDISPRFTYRPVSWVGAQIGYRLLVVGLEDGSGAEEFSYEGSLAGLFFGVQLSF